jgi:tetraacyldisaccharide 4'-kinase
MTMNSTSRSRQADTGKKITGRLDELLEKWKEVLVLTTEKDAVKFRELEPDPLLADRLYAIRIKVHFLNDDQEEFNQKISSYVASNKRSSFLYKK